MVTETTTESELDDVSLLEIQSPGTKIDFCIKLQLEIPGCQNDNGIRHRGICLNHLKKSVQRELF